MLLLAHIAIYSGLAPVIGEILQDRVLNKCLHNWNQHPLRSAFEVLTFIGSLLVSRTIFPTTSLVIQVQCSVLVGVSSVFFSEIFAVFYQTHLKSLITKKPKVSVCLSLDSLAKLLRNNMGEKRIMFENSSEETLRKEVKGHKEVKKLKGRIARKGYTLEGTDGVPKFSWKEIAVHSNPGSAWIVICGVVYDVTTFLPRHPGGEEVMRHFLGEDATDVFRAFHNVEVDPRTDPNCRRLLTMLKAFAIGTVAPENPTDELYEADTSASDSGSSSDEDQNAFSTRCFLDESQSTVNENQSLVRAGANKLKGNRRSRKHKLNPYRTGSTTVSRHHQRLQKSSNRTKSEIEQDFRALHDKFAKQGKFETDVYNELLYLVITFSALLFAFITPYLFNNMSIAIDNTIHSLNVAMKTIAVVNEQNRENMILLNGNPSSTMTSLYNEVLKITIAYMARKLAFFNSFLPSIGASLTGLALGFFTQQIAFLLHDTLHTSRKKQGFHFRGWFYANVGFGISSRMWHSHHSTHHAISLRAPQQDPQFDYLPVFLTSSKQIEKKNENTDRGSVPENPTSSVLESFCQFMYGSLLYFLVKHQGYTLLPVTLLFGRVSFLAKNFLYAVMTPPQGYSGSEARAIDLFGIFLFYAWNSLMWLNIIQYLCAESWFPLVSFALAYIVSTGFLHLQLLLNHLGVENFTQEESRNLTYAELQIRTNRNVAGIALLRTYPWLQGGLDHHIEHHLFPRMPRHRLREVAGDVKKFCQRNGLPYNSLSFTDTVYLSLQALKDVSNCEELEELMADLGSPLTNM
eukprot:g68.t1